LNTIESIEIEDNNPRRRYKKEGEEGEEGEEEVPRKKRLVIM